MHGEETPRKNTTAKMRCGVVLAVVALCLASVVAGDGCAHPPCRTRAVVQHGPRGARGATGADGATGATGATGAAGPATNTTETLRFALATLSANFLASDYLLGQYFTETLTGVKPVMLPGTLAAGSLYFLLPRPGTLRNLFFTAQSADFPAGARLTATVYTATRAPALPPTFVSTSLSASVVLSSNVITFAQTSNLVSRVTITEPGEYIGLAVHFNTSSSSTQLTLTASVEYNHL